MELAKKIFVYSMVLLGLIITAGLVAASYLFLVPDGQIFGFYYVSGSIGTETDTYTEGANTYDTLEIETIGYDVYLYPKEDATEITVAITSNVNGYARAGGSEFGYIYDYNTDSGVLRIKTIEPFGGAMFYNDATLFIAVPEVAIPKDVRIKSSGSKIILGDITEPEGSDLTTQHMELGNVLIENGTGEIKIQNFTIDNSLSISNVAGRTEVLGDVNADVVLGSSIGTFIFRDEDNELTDITGNLTVNASNAAVEVGNLYTYTIEEEDEAAPGGYATIEVGGQLSYNGASGLLEVAGAKGDVFITTNNCEVDLGTVEKNLSIESDFGKVIVDKIGLSYDSDYSAYINAENGSITINETHYELELVTKHGSIDVTNSFAYVDAVSEYGDITVSFAPSAVARDLRAISIEGSITAENIKGVAYIQVRDSGMAQVSASFLEVNGTSTIIGSRRTVDLVVPIDLFKLDITALDGGLDIVVADVYKTSWQEADYVVGEYKFAAGVSGYTGDIDKIVITVSHADVSIKTS